MNIVGGAYGEAVVVPHRTTRVLGSGVRAALALNSPDASLVSAIADEELESFASAVASLPVPPRSIPRDRPVRFDYFTPLSTPSITGAGAVLREPLVVDADQVLAYGLIEQGGREIRARQAVLDPQSPSASLHELLAGVKCDEVLLSVNARELDHMVPGQLGIVEKADQLRRKSEARGVVVRAGARGCLALEERSASWLSAAPTLHVMSVGSGDVFNAALSHAWFLGADLETAARVGMTATAWSCSSEETRLPSWVLKGESHPDGSLPSDTMANGYCPNVYLAGPFFAVAQRWLVDSVLSWASALGARVFSPIHHVGPGGDEVARQDIDALERSDVILALLDGYDAGTIYELGWAARMRIPIVAHISTLDRHQSKMLVGLGAELHDDLTTALYRAIWVGQGALPAPGRHAFQRSAT